MMVGEEGGRGGGVDVAVEVEPRMSAHGSRDGVSEDERESMRPSRAIPSPPRKGMNGLDRDGFGTRGERPRRGYRDRSHRLRDRTSTDRRFDEARLLLFDKSAM